ncbi:hypothetical protein Lalb_Chr19g0129741 [Lupinus albus]|uniref:Uncharacterized protein n=1 Tax=Lupinus albus TaxID=3870 RepID=A0A6A4NTH0_LUPAL|nr:hypothetical protein Lalb_Chr19g0129741 [Lupinus albus]
MESQILLLLFNCITLEGDIIACLREGIYFTSSLFVLRKSNL